MLEVKNHRIVNIVPDNVLISELVVMPDLQYRLECVPDDEHGVNEKKELLVACAHFSQVHVAENAMNSQIFRQTVYGHET